MPGPRRVRLLWDAFTAFFLAPFRTNDAEAKGLRLLRSWLTSEQRNQFDSYGYFDVVGNVTGVRYRIRYGVAANVEQLDSEGHPLVGRCFLPIGYLVAGDVMLAQKIALETNERSALAVSQKFFVSDPFRREASRVLSASTGQPATRTGGQSWIQNRAASSASRACAASRAALIGSAGPVVGPIGAKRTSLTPMKRSASRK
jgi:hypothetical protein